ncbi:MAG: ABC transporter substrate-binding protein [Rhodospirillales bacterium]|nr:ABC transporter substrate-binding protein [Rhodospirillales bacterium]
MMAFRLPMTFRHVLLMLALVLAAWVSPPLAGGAAEPVSGAAAQAVVKGFADEGVSLLEDRGASPAARAERFRELLKKYFATDAIARWVLGRYWNQLDAQQRVDYQSLFEDLVVYGYVKRFGEYTGERLRIVRTIADSDAQATVFSEIDRPAGGQPVRVDWRVGGRDGVYLITDVVVENVSLSQTWRSDFSATIRQSGGINGLLDTLRVRTAQLKADLGVSR